MAGTHAGGGIEDKNYLATVIHLDCPACRSPVVTEGFHWRLRFPLDDELIASVLEGRLNLSDCPVCQSKVGVLAPFLAIHEDRTRHLFVEGLEVFARALKDEQGESIVQHLPGLTICQDYDQLRHALLPWVLEQVKDLAVIVVNGLVAGIETPERLKLASRPKLRFLRMVADGVLTIMLQLSPEVEARICQQMGEAEVGNALKKLWPQQVDGLVFQLLRDEFGVAMQADTLAELPARIERRVGGSPIVTGRVLQWCLEECVELDTVADDPGTFSAAYRAHFLNAVAHQLTGQPNPARAAWSAFLWFAFHASRKGWFRDGWLPAASEAARLVRFEDLWNRCIPELHRKSKQFEESLQDICALMERFGYTERLVAMMQAAPIRPHLATENPVHEGESLRKALLNLLHERFPFPLDDESRPAFAAVSAGQVKNLVLGGLPEEAAHLAQELVQRALEAKDYVGAFQVGVQAVAHLAGAELFDEAVEVLAPLMNIFTRQEVSAQLEKAGAELTVSFWNEAGNVLRQLGKYHEALRAYYLSREFLELVEGDRHEALEAILVANESRVFRDQGRYGEARRRLEQMLRRAPNDVLALHSLALLHLQLNEHQLARACMDRALLNPDVRLEPVLHARLLQTRGMACAGAGEATAGLLDLSTALDVAAEQAATLVTRICISIVMTAASSNHPVVERAKTRLVAVLRGQVDHARSREESLYATVLAAYGDFLIEQGSNDALRDYLDEWLAPFLAAFDGSELPWQLLAVRGRVGIQLEGLADAWQWLERALVRLDAVSPIGEDASALLGWLRDKNRFQLELADAAIRLVREGQIPPQALLPVFEFTIARSTSAKLGENSVFDTAARVPELLAAASARTVGTLHAVAFLEGRNQVQAFVISAGEKSPRLIEQAHFRTSELRALQSRFAEVLVSANPKNLSRVDAKLHEWSTFARTLGPLVAEVAVEEDTIALLPCSSLAGLPLHLCPLDSAGVPLIERHLVVYAGNFGTLLSRPGPDGGARGRLVVAVAKAQDRHLFQNALSAAAERIAAARPGETRVLAGTDAALPTILEGLRSCDEAWFLCHGAYGGREAGFALCISDGVVLPPSLLSIDEVHALKRFTLDWIDLESLDRAPELLVSIACSSGRTLIDAGGSRLGIEQALLAKGTRAIIAPQWDVDQDAALEWLHAFEARPAESKLLNTAKRCQHAGKAVRERFGHWYFWGAFTFTGSVFNWTDKQERTL